MVFGRKKKKKSKRRREEPEEELEPEEEEFDEEPEEPEEDTEVIVASPALPKKKKGVKVRLTAEQEAFKVLVEEYRVENPSLFFPQDFGSVGSAQVCNLLFGIWVELRKLREVVEGE